MSSSFTLEKLNTLLVQDEEHWRSEEEELRRKNAQLEPIQESIRDIYRKHGILTPSTGHYKRPISANLFRCSISAPQTTLVSWSLLPNKIRSRLTAPPTDENGIVEVPISYLVPDDDEDQDGTSNTLQRRPLGGNLSSKLTEYTRGVAGQARPFRPGGLDASELSSNTLDDEQELLEAMLRAREVFKKGSEAAWRDGTLLTAPPGVGFKVGLGWKHVSGEDIPKGMDVTGGTTAVDDVARSTDEVARGMGRKSASRDTANGSVQLGRSERVWDKAVFDDDSLFGDSSSESDESSLDGETGSETEYEKEGASSKPVEESVASTVSQAREVVAGSIDEVDYLLAELSLGDNGTYTKKKPAEAFGSNPLRLAQEQENLAQNASRKSWADTVPLRIDDFDTHIPNPALRFPFQLDDFQQQAVARIERSESIFVAAHTSAGKTVCAEYAIALCQQHCTRAVYTSPIKALSNQKFRDFSNKFGAKNVGLITGDMQLNVDDSTVLIMTTEILRSMLYRGADLIRDIEWVIFDEVHYVNDSERGVVWEEVIIMLPSYVNCIFLSATTPNTIEFSDWIGRTKRKPVHVIRTSYRPVPLSHFLWAGLKLHKIREGKGNFLEKGYKESARALLPPSSTKKGTNDKKSSGSRPTAGAKHMAWQQQGSKQNWQSLVKFLDRESMTPTVVFSFSKKKCEEIAYMIRSLDLNTGAERSAVQAFTLQTVARLSPNDATLPQVLTVCDMCKRGIGVHHGGLLPILKEMVEILFSRNLIKVLFATETFAMGVNLPVRSVVFNSIRKHDGTQFRILEPGEYTQMAGRAGRRGIDSVGTVILCCFGEEPPPMPILRHMLTGSSTKLSSQFRLTYNMILNLLRVEDMSVEGMIKRSFSEFATQRALTANDYPKLLARGEKTLEKLDDQFRRDASSRIGADDLEAYFDACSDLIALNSELLSYILQSPDGKGSDVYGRRRIVLVTAARKHGYVRAPAIVLRPPSLLGGGDSRSSLRKMVCMVLLPESYVPQDDVSATKALTKSGTLGFTGTSKHRHYAIHEIDMDEIVLVSSRAPKVEVEAVFKDVATPHTKGRTGPSSRLDTFPNAFPAVRNGGGDFDAFMGVKAKGKKGAESQSLLFGSKLASAEEENIKKIVEHLLEAEADERSSDLNALDLRDKVKRGSEVLEFRKACDKMESLVVFMRSFQSHHHPNIEGHYTVLERKETLRSRVATLRHLLSNESLQLFPDFLQRKALLRTLGYVDESETVCVKGRVACEVNTCEELIVTEMVFEGVLNDLEPAEIVAALSSLVYQEKRDTEEFDAELPETLILCCEKMKTIATNLGQLQKEHGLDIDPKDYSDASLKFGLVHVVYEWALGVQFSSICELTLVQEGSIVRCVTRLDELCREVRNCARVVGNPTLYRKMELASAAIKRDIVFASSLYVT